MAYPTPITPASHSCIYQYSNIGGPALGHRLRTLSLFDADSLRARAGDASRNPAQQTNSVSPIPQRRVSNIVQGSSSATSSNGLHSGQHSRTRPPVPLFANNSPGTINQHLQSSMSAHQTKELDFVDWSQADDDSGFSAVEENNMDSYPRFSSLNHLSRHTSYASMTPADTVSTHEIFSAPPSGEFSSFPTPDTPFMDSPDTGCFTGESLIPMELPAESNSWRSLFAIKDDKPQVNPPSLPQHYSIESPTMIDAEDFPPAMSRDASSPGKTSSRGSKSGRQSSSCGVTKSRRVKSELPPIIVEDKTDTIAMKRARNTMAARKSRDRRATHMEELETEVARLREENDKLNREIDHLRSIEHAKVLASKHQ